MRVTPTRSPERWRQDVGVDIDLVSLFWLVTTESDPVHMVDVLCGDSGLRRVLLRVVARRASVATSGLDRRRVWLGRPASGQSSSVGDHLGGESSESVSPSPATKCTLHRRSAESPLLTTLRA